MTLAELLSLIKKKWGLVVAFPIIAALVTAGISWGLLPNQYTSSVSMYVLSTSESSSSSQNVTSSDMTASQQLANDIAVLAESNRVIDATAEALGMSNLDDYDIEVQSETTNRVITLSVTGQRPESVAQVADEAAAQTAATAIEVMNLQAVNIIDQAEVPENPSGPNRTLYVAVAALAGLFVAIALIVLLDMLDTTIRDAEDAEDLLGLPVLGRMPKLK